MHEPEDYPDKTVDELLDADDDAEFGFTEEEYEEMQEGYAELREGAVLFMQAAALGEMLAEGEITLRQYIEWIDWVEDKADEKGVEIP
jgi:hypothetical protein